MKSDAVIRGGLRIKREVIAAADIGHISKREPYKLNNKIDSPDGMAACPASRVGR